MFVHSLLSVTFVEFTSKSLVKMSFSEYISNHSPENIHIWTMGTWEGRLLCNEFWSKGSWPGVGLKVKI